MATAIRKRPSAPVRLQWGNITLHLLLIIGAIIMILPFLWMLSTSLKTQTDVMREFPPRLIPSTFMWSNYSTALGSLPFGRFYVNSLIVAGSVTILQLFTSSLAAYAFARLRFKGRDILFFLYLIGLMIPFP